MSFVGLFLFPKVFLSQMHVTELQTGVNGALVFEQYGKKCKVRKSRGKITIGVENEGRNTIAPKEISKESGGSMHGRKRK